MERVQAFERWLPLAFMTVVVQWLFTEFGIDNADIFIGSSAGVHVVAFIGVLSGSIVLTFPCVILLRWYLGAKRIVLLGGCVTLYLALVGFFAGLEGASNPEYWAVPIDAPIQYLVASFSASVLIAWLQLGAIGYVVNLVKRTLNEKRNDGQATSGDGNSNRVLYWDIAQ